MPMNKWEHLEVDFSQLCEVFGWLGKVCNFAASILKFVTLRQSKYY